MLFTSNKRDLKLNSQTITRLESTNRLEVIIDEHLTLREHIHNVKI